MNLQKVYKDRIKSYEPLSRHTTLCIGGKARWWFEPSDRNDLIRFLADAKKTSPCFVIGNGSNLLVKDGTIKKAFIRLSSRVFTRIVLDGVTVTAGAGVSLSRLVAFLNSKNMRGHEFLTGIPGTLGGALAMNAGALENFNDASSYRQMKDIVQEVEVLDTKGSLKKLTKKEIRFSYRQASLKRFIILSARLKLRRGIKGKAKKIACGIMKERLKRQDWRYPSAGSIFKNPSQSQSAGFLIDRAGLKGLSVGGAFVSQKHANFIINKKGATYADVIKLMEKIKKIVYNRFKVKLQPEVEIVS